MSTEQNNHLFYLFAFSNFLAAFGGGMILGKGIGVINVPYLQSGSILAFFIGTVLGLAFLQCIPRRISKPIAKWFSICGALTSLCLLLLFKNNSVSGRLDGTIGLIFFSLLSIRFAFWFYSRVLRAANVAGREQKIAWVELGYYLGMILGLIIWEFFGVNLTLEYALLIDAILQFTAGSLDLKENSIQSNQAKINESEILKINYEKEWAWRLLSAVVLLTIGVQVIIFYLAHNTSDYVASYILATFYFGVSVAAFLYKKLSLNLNWINSSAIICTPKRISLNSSILILLCGISVGIVILGINFSLINNQLIVYTFIFSAAFLYEILSIALLDRIGLEEKYSTNSNMIMRTYGLMGIGAAISLWLFGLTGTASLGMILVLISCLFISLLAIYKRKVQENMYV